MSSGIPPTARPRVDPIGASKKWKCPPQTLVRARIHRLIIRAPVLRPSLCMKHSGGLNFIISWKALEIFCLQWCD
jgi:hypothetical protein